MLNLLGQQLQCSPHAPREDNRHAERDDYTHLLSGPGGHSLTRREFLRVGGLAAGAVGLSLNDLHAANAGAGGVNCILLFLVGGPSQLETWDMKPGAPSDVRGPFRPIRTNVPGIEICEHFPHMARMADRFAIVRSVHHEEAAIHETGQQLIQTGRLGTVGMEYPHCGAVMSYLQGRASTERLTYALLPGPMSFTGAALGHGQGAGFLGQLHEPVSLRADTHDKYGPTSFSQSCLLARRLVERGVRMVTVNMFDTIFNTVTWDCHADGGMLNSSLDDHRETLCPMFDKAYSALLEDLHQRGLLEKTLVVAMGEFGRTPHINPRGGRDHWPGVWSILLAGGGVKGGQVIGSSDRLGAEPRDRPVRPAEVVATIYRALGVDPATLLLGPGGRRFPLVDAAPLEELF
jgi:Protein of unknown function (DUF1501)